MQVFVFFDPDNEETIAHFQAWETAWRSAGHQPRILTLRQAQDAGRKLGKPVTEHNAAWLSLSGRLTSRGATLCDSVAALPDGAGHQIVKDREAALSRC